MSAEVYGEFNEKKNFVPIVIQKTEDQKNQIKSRLLHSFLFNNLEKNELEVVIDAMEEKTYEENEEVIKQGENGDCLYVVESGELNCSKRFVRINFNSKQEQKRRNYRKISKSIRIRRRLRRVSSSLQYTESC